MKRPLLREQFIHHLGEHEQRYIVDVLSQACLQFLGARRPVFLEGFGIIEPQTLDAYRSYFADRSQVSRIETIIRPTFHKCNELTNYHRERHSEIVETRELAQRAYALLPVEHSALWSNKETQLLIKGLIETVKHETVSQGCSTRLPKIGSFYALHNRQGESFADWFAGSDIFVRPSFETSIRSGDSQIFPRPTISKLAEVTSALFGAPIKSVQIDGMKGTVINQASKSTSGIQSVITVSVHLLKESNINTYVFVSDGIRALTPPAPAEETQGVEFTLQVAVDTGITQTDEPPSWPFSLFSRLWQLVASNPSQPPAIGTVFEVPKPICPDAVRCTMSGVILSDFTRFHREQLAKEGPFIVRNVVGITDDELLLAQEASPQHLLHCLAHRNLSQVTKISRPSILTRSSLFGSGHIRESSAPQAHVREPRDSDHQVAV